MRSYQLRVKTLALLAERVIIARERARLYGRIAKAEAKPPPDEHLAEASKRLAALWREYASIGRHDADVVKRELRSTLLARGYLRGLPYERLERFVRDLTPKPDEAAVARMVLAYGPPFPFGQDDGQRVRIKAWVTEGHKAAVARWKVNHEAALARRAVRAKARERERAPDPAESAA